MDGGLEPQVRKRSQPVGISVTPEQTRLEKQQAHGPDGGAAAKPGQDVTPHHRLHLEQQKGAQKDRAGKENMIRWVK